MFETMQKRRSIRRKRAFRKTTDENFSYIKLCVVAACLLIIAADLLYFGGTEILKFPFPAKDTGNHPAITLSLDEQLTLAGMKDIAPEGAAGHAQIIGEEPQIMPDLWKEIQFISEIRIIESDKFVAHEAEKTSTDAGFKTMSFGEMEPVPIMQPILLLGFGMAVLMAVRSKIVY